MTTARMAYGSLLGFDAIDWAVVMFGVASAGVIFILGI